LTKVFEEVFDQSGLKVTPETTANDVEGWDSMSHVTMLMAVEDHFKIEFKPYEIANLVNGELWLPWWRRTGRKVTLVA
jgi:acyl carrier protein